MASDRIDMSLDDIIKLSKKGNRGKGPRGGRGLRGNQRGNRSGNRGRNIAGTAAATLKSGRGFRSGRFRSSFGGGIRGRSGFRGRSSGLMRGGVQKRGRSRQPVFTQRQVEGMWQHDLFEGGSNFNQKNSEGKLLISNLDFGVNDSDIQELFTEFGQLRKAAVHYDFSGRSLGTAEVTFSNQSEALKAMKQYNTVPLDGRPMKIQLVSDRVAQVTSPGARRGGNRGRGRAGFGNRLGSATSNKSGGFATGNRRGGNQNQRRGGRGRGRGRGGRSSGVVMTREQLDAQLDQYNKMDIN